jgi:hypothetical protein
MGTLHLGVSYVYRRYGSGLGRGVFFWNRLGTVASRGEGFDDVDGGVKMGFLVCTVIDKMRCYRLFVTFGVDYSCKCA